MIEQTLARAIRSIELSVCGTGEAGRGIGTRRAGKVARGAQLVGCIIIVSCIANARRTVSRSTKIS